MSELVKVGEKSLTIEELQNKLTSAEVGQEITSDYETFEVGEIKRIIFVEMVEMNGMGAKSKEMIDAIKYVSASDGKIKINADAALVSLCKGLSSKGKLNIALEVTCTGKATSKSGFPYKEFTVNELIFTGK